MGRGWGLVTEISEFLAESASLGRYSLKNARIARPVVIRELKSMAVHAPAEAHTLLKAPHYTTEERDTLGAIVSFLEAQAARFLEAAGLLRGVRLD